MHSAHILETEQSDSNGWAEIVIGGYHIKSEDITTKIVSE